MPPPFVFVTGNEGKLAEARRLCGGKLRSANIDLPEIQSLDLGAILEAKANEAWQRLRQPLVVEETGLELSALGGFPGPLIKWMLHSIGAEGIARAALALGDSIATARCALLYIDGERRIAAAGETRGHLTLPARGRHGFGWDPVFVPDDGTRTYGELAGDEKDRISHRGRAWRALLENLR